MPVTHHLVYMTEIKSAGYSVFIAKNITKEINRFFKAADGKYSTIFILVDENSLNYCYPQLVGKIDDFKNAEIIEIDSGEDNKSLEVCVPIWNTLSEFGADRKSLFVNLGGGVITDMGGFIASTFKRGIDFINIPTTLLSQVDASVGGKTGVDLNNLKNEIGVFSTPTAVFVNPEFISTLENKQVLSGFAEVIKHALIADSQYWKGIKKVKPDSFNDWESIIADSVKIKNDVVLKDPKENDLRKILNFGHTIGHAIESYSFENNKPLLHGEAIAAGMICEAYLSNKICGLPDKQMKEISNFILKHFKNIFIEKMDASRLLDLMKHDKKNHKTVINFSLLSGIGKCEINKTAKASVIQEALQYYAKEAKRTK